MKNILKTNIRLLSVALAFTSILACTDDDLPGLDPLPKNSRATTTVSSINIVEGETAVIPFTINQAISKPSQFKIEKVSGTLGQADVNMGDQDTDGDTGIPHVGYEITVPAYATSFDIPVSALSDNIIPNGGCDEITVESGTYRITAAGVRTILTPTSEGYLVDVTVTDDGLPASYVWTLQLQDSYGDGWNGASLGVTIDGLFIGNATIANGGNATFTIPMTIGTTYEFEFFGGAWDSEITYSIIDSEGNVVFSDGPNPTIGVVLTGTQEIICE